MAECSRESNVQIVAFCASRYGLAAVTRRRETVESELYLRFGCPSCGRALLTPLLRLDDAEHRCKHCSDPVRAPGLGEGVLGRDELFKACPPTIDLCCPSCGRELQAPVTAVGRKRKCPSCMTELGLELVGRSGAERPTGGKAGREFQRPVSPNATSAGGTEKVHRQPPEFEPEHDELVGADDLEVVSDSEIIPRIVDPSESRSVSAAPSLLGSPRAVHWGIYLTLQLGVPFWSLMLFEYAGEGLKFLLAFTFIIPILGFGWMWRLAAALTPLFVSHFLCPGCGERHEAVGLWQCSCGYVPHRESHVLSSKCPLCGNYIGRTNCQRCNATIMLRPRFWWPFGGGEQ